MAAIKFWAFDSVYLIDGYSDGIVMPLSVHASQGNVSTNLCMQLPWNFNGNKLYCIVFQDQMIIFILMAMTVNILYLLVWNLPKTSMCL